MKKKIIKISRKLAFLVVVIGSMWIGSSIQLYYDLLSKLPIQKELSIWHKLLGYTLLFNLDEYKGTICEILGNITLATFTLWLVLLITFLFIEVIAKKKAKSVSRV